ncbi:BZ3500_MvSof-1268-A1-R1_Chr2-2g05025 [Microbotryum saponariae]|uniref:BZ3500_MvSof-1268-A1-R1_Chr2-2g05025 protein n=1 Tax=Microbotryum saponariae TaxID=289078 RepID=A0A2X0K5A2_9BASI|nr:BZ3500_MvSof-1268-A1-R1_Chr2-2g05025 [Microbotryum saponariae]SDA00730.1 BZ3501_MvSof-1269-A2-R1_Chr2-2g04699 [Microbotryum saponariae]
MIPPQRKSDPNQAVNSKKRKRIARTSRETSCESCRRRKLKCTSARPACSICLHSAQLHGLDPIDAICHYSVGSIHTIDYDRTVDQMLKKGCCVVDRGLKQQLADAISQLTDKQRRGELDLVLRRKRKALDETLSSSKLQESCASETPLRHITASRRSTRFFARPDLGLITSSEQVRTPCKSSPSPPQDHPPPVSSPGSSSPLSSLVADTPLHTEERYPKGHEEAIQGISEEPNLPESKIEPADHLSTSLMHASVLTPAPLSPPSVASPSPSKSDLGQPPTVGSVIATLDSTRVKRLEDTVCKIEDSLAITLTTEFPSLGGSSETKAENDLDRLWAPPLLLSEDFWLPGPLRKEELWGWRVIEAYGMTL